MSERDWTEDFSGENGNYQNHCVCCGRLFMGHKRRGVCKSCGTPESVKQRIAALEWELAEAKAEVVKSRSVCEEIENYAMTANQTVLDERPDVRDSMFSAIRDMARKGIAGKWEAREYEMLQAERDRLRKALEWFAKEMDSVRYYSGTHPDTFKLICLQFEKQIALASAEKGDS